MIHENHVLSFLVFEEGSIWVLGQALIKYVDAQIILYEFLSLFVLVNHNYVIKLATACMFYFVD